MELAILDVAFALGLDGVEAAPRGVVVTVYPAVSAATDGPHDLNGGRIKGEGEVLLLCGGDSLGGDFDDLECGHDEIGGEDKNNRDKDEYEQEQQGDVGRHVGEDLGVQDGTRKWWL